MRWRPAAPASCFDYLTASARSARNAVDFPVDTWLYGVARVREKMHAWEQTVMFAGAFGQPEPELEAMQLPFIPDDRWLASGVPAGAEARHRPAALHRALRDAVRQGCAPVRAAARRMDRDDPGRRRRHRHHLSPRPARTARRRRRCCWSRRPSSAARGSGTIWSTR